MIHLTLFTGPNFHVHMQAPLLKNIYWKELSLLVYVWVAFFIVQIVKVIKLFITHGLIF